MSHHTLKIGSATPNALGEVAVTLSDISDVSGTPTDGQNLQYDSNTGLWSPITPSGATKEYFLWGRGESRDYSYSPAATSLNSDARRIVRLFLYDTNHVNTISGSTLSTRTDSGTGGSHWFDYIDLPIGTYRFTFIVNVVFSSTGYLEFGLQGTTGNMLTNWGKVGDSSPTGSICSSIQTVSANERVRPYVGLASGVAGKSSQGTLLSKSSSLLIEKLS